MLRSALGSVFRRGRGVLTAVFLCLALAAPLAAQGTTPPPAPPSAQEGFEPVTGAVTEQLPAAPLVMGAYGFVWVVLVAYVWSVARRLSKVQDELDRLDSQLSKER